MKLKCVPPALILIQTVIQTITINPPRFFEAGRSISDMLIATTKNKSK
ncbi:hypothetical protein SAMN02910353_03084 [Ruminococcus sp. YRD2003]|nr:hypothetical protein SAMN02910353_03084 [Ruminococcus flavefaciens]